GGDEQGGGGRQDGRQGRAAAVGIQARFVGGDAAHLGALVAERDVELDEGEARDGDAEGEIGGVGGAGDDAELGLGGAGGEGDQGGAVAGGAGAVGGEGGAARVAEDAEAHGGAGDGLVVVVEVAEGERVDLAVVEAERDLA